jgi:hypothetical protein
MHNSTARPQFILRKRKSWVGLQSQHQAIHKLITGQNEIEQTNDQVKVAHSPVVRAMETNSKKLRTPNSILWSIQILDLYLSLHKNCMKAFKLKSQSEFHGILQ